MLLERMRKGVSKIVIQFLALLLIASFALWGVGDMVGVISNPDEIATVDGDRVTSREFRRQFRVVMDNARRRYGDIDMEQARALGLADTALDAMLSRHVLELEARKLGLRASDDLVARRIRAEPAFRDSLGQFDRAVYQAVLANNGLAEGEYADSVRGDVQRGFLTDAVGGAVAPAVLVDALHRFRNERRSAEFVRIARKDPERAPEPSDAELAEYFAENADAFMAPEYRRLTVLRLDPAETAKEMEPGVDAVREEYENRLDSITVPERRRVEQIVTPSEENARRLRERVAGGADFAVAEGDSSARKTDLGTVARSELLPAVAEAAFALGKDGVSEPVRTPLGWHVVRVTAIEPGRTPSFDETKERIRDDLARELALDALVGQSNAIEDVLAGGGTLEDAASAVGARPLAVAAVDIELKAPDGTPVGGLPEDPRFAEVAFTTDEGETGDVVDGADGGYFLVRVDGTTPPAKRPLEEVRAEVALAWKTARLDDDAETEATAILEAARSGTSLENQARTRGLKVAVGGPVDRAGRGEGAPLPPGVVVDLFSAKEGEHFVSRTADGYAVARARAVENAAPDGADEGYGRLRDALTEALNADLLEEYTRALRKGYDVVVDRAAFDAIFATP